MQNTTVSAVIGELQRLAIRYEQVGASEVRVTCPFHDDKSPSLDVNIETGKFKCRSTQCAQSGDLAAYLSKLQGIPVREILIGLSTRYNISTDRTIDVAVIETAHRKLMLPQALGLRQELYKRGITDADIRQYRLGESKNRITIPIKNAAGSYVNLRSYLPGAPGSQKMRNMRNRGMPIRLYPIEQLKYSNLVLAGGEMKAIALASRINKHGYGAVTTTGGEGSWSDDFRRYVEGKEVWVMMDIDKAGRKAASKLCMTLSRMCEAVYDVVLPLDLSKHPKGDINDWIATEHATAEQIVQLLETTEPWDASTAEPETPSGVDPETADETPLVVSLSSATHASYTNRRLEVTGVVGAVRTTPYSVPKEVTVSCSREEACCEFCPVFSKPEEHVYTVHPESQEIIGMLNSPDRELTSLVKSALGVPSMCLSFKHDTQSSYNVEDARISDQLAVASRDDDEKTLQPAVCIGPGLKIQETYKFTGRQYPHPKTQEVTLLFSKYEATGDTLGTYVVPEGNELQLFQPESWTTESLGQRLDAIYEDLESNVTNIYERRVLHLFCDLAYHSPLYIEFDGKSMIKGHTEILIVGDSAQGKSETAMGLQAHYDLGAKIECKNATVAGLIGGMQQLNGRWFTTWGLIPMHDRRLVILEELKGADTSIIAKLTDMRSSGFAELHKIDKQRARARTRLLALSNPRSSGTIATYTYGVRALQELVGSPEDLRRFDACLVVAAGEVGDDVISMLRRDRPSVEHVHTAELCRSLVLWCWTVPKVTFTEEAARMISKLSKELQSRYTDTIPIVDSGSMHYKLIRLSAALAGRTYSTDDSGASMLVRGCHVEYVVDTLRAVYDASSFGYNAFTEAERARSNMQDPELITRRINETPFPAVLIQKLCIEDKIENQDIQNWCKWDFEEAKSFIGFLVRKQALARVRNEYVKTAPFIALLKTMNATARPDFINEPEF